MLGSKAVAAHGAGRAARWLPAARTHGEWQIPYPMVLGTLPSTRSVWAIGTSGSTKYLCDEQLLLVS